MGSAQIEAAGGVVWRTRHDQVELLLVHRPRYDDWTFPKGKLEDDESAIDAARREVEEETGFRCTAGDKLQTVRYDDHKGRPKRVRYWVMTIDDGSFRPNDEVDEIAWLPPDRAARCLSYDHDRELVGQFLESGRP